MKRPLRWLRALALIAVLFASSRAEADGGFMAVQYDVAGGRTFTHSAITISNPGAGLIQFPIQQGAGDRLLAGGLPNPSAYTGSVTAARTSNAACRRAPSPVTVVYGRTPPV